MKKFIGFIIVLACFLEPIPAVAATGDATISNGSMTVSMKNAYGGAITSVIYNGIEFVRTSTHGASFQLAWQNNDVGECWNPTSDGTQDDANKNTSTTLITSFIQNAKSIEENFYPAYWLSPPGQTSPYCYFKDENPPRWQGGTAFNTTPRTTSNVHQLITLDPEGLTNVVKIDNTITFGSTDTDTGIPLKYILADQPAVFLPTGKFTYIYRYDESTQTAVHVTSAQMQTNRNEPWIVSTSDGQTAMGIYSNQVPSTLPTSWPQSIFTGYGVDYMVYPGENIWYLRVRLPHFAPTGTSKISQGSNLSLRSYLVFGSVSEVSGKLHQLYLLHPPLTENCLSNSWKAKLELSDCTTTPTTIPTSKPGDLNGDNKVDIFDYNIIVGNFGHPYTIFDYNTLIGNFGK